MIANIVFIRPNYFKHKSNYLEMLNPNNLAKQSSRFYLSIETMYNGCSFFVPLRRNIDLTIGCIGYPVPSSTKPHAGLDYRKALVINDDKYINHLETCGISSSQMNKMFIEKHMIERSFIKYVERYVKAARKNRENIDKLFKYSTLHNFHAELGLETVSFQAQTKQSCCAH